MVSGLTPPIGNDLVAWSSPSNAGKSRDLRFVSRVFSCAEQDYLNDSPDPDRALWLLWAAKEACYKISLKQNPQAKFSPVYYVVSVDQSGSAGEVSSAALRFRWRAFVGPEWLHVWAVDAMQRDTLLERVETAVAWVGQEESSGVRRLALNLLASRAVSATVEGRPPRFVSGGNRVPGDLSLSHDEGYGAVAWLPG